MNSFDVDTESEKVLAILGEILMFNKILKTLKIKSLQIKNESRLSIRDIP